MHDSLDTKQVGVILDRPPDSLRTSLCRDGEVYGIVPMKNPKTKRLEWPLAEVLKARDSASPRGRICAKSTGATA